MNSRDAEIIRMKEQIVDLKAELVELSGKLHSGARELKQAARPTITAFRENPGTVPSFAVTAGLVGVTVGYVLAAGVSGTQTNDRWHA